MGQALESTTELAPEAEQSPTSGVVVSKIDDITIHAHDRFIGLIQDYLALHSQADWLDVGCGWHFDWRWEEKRERELLSRAKVVGLDPDWQAIVRHRSIEKRAAGVIERMPFASETFDLVTANVVVEHLKHPALAFAEIFRVLRPGGVFVFRTPSARSHFVRIAKLLPQRLKVCLAAGILEDRSSEDVYPAHYLANTAEDVGALCQMLGFRSTNILITRAQGALSKVPLLAQMERAVAGAFGMKEGNLLVRTEK